MRLDMKRTIPLVVLFFALTTAFGQAKKADKTDDAQIKQEIIKQSIASYKGAVLVRTASIRFNGALAVLK
jgi:hypothetical protein